MYDRTKVDWTEAEHEQFAKLDDGIERILTALGDGFQPLQDFDDVALAGWALADIVRTRAARWAEVHPGEKPTAKDIALPVAEAFVALNRDNSYFS